MQIYYINSITQAFFIKNKQAKAKLLISQTLCIIKLIFSQHSLDFIEFHQSFHWSDRVDVQT